MKTTELIDAAEKKVGGLRELARTLNYDPGSLSTARKTGKVPAWVAGACAQLVGEDPEIAEVEAQAAASRSDAESDYWRRRLRRLRGVLGAIMFIAAPFYSGAHSSIAEAHAHYSLSGSAENIHYAQYVALIRGEFLNFLGH